jgi:acetylornithine/N-succinyldiaminopimelate aminotransferase
VSKCLNAGLIVIAAENNTVRFVPPLVISNEDIDQMISILSMTIKGN